MWRRLRWTSAGESFFNFSEGRRPRGAHQDPGHVIEAKPVLITQDYLNKNEIRTLAESRALMLRPRPGRRSRRKVAACAVSAAEARRIPRSRSATVARHLCKYMQANASK
jgi:hypothetical protein